MSLLRPRNAREAVITQNTTIGNVFRYSGVLMGLLFCVYVGRYWWAAGIVAVFAVTLGPEMWYLAKHEQWYRRWVIWVTVINIASCLVSMLTKHVWWLFLSGILTVGSVAFIDRALTEFGRRHGIQEDLDDIPPPPRDEQ